jgi:prepilin-type processing-associated H-X9-DG protein/prepilin-type N-terminal cleavage/methylation domain-containing protein
MKREVGFTIIELLAVVVVLAILAALIVPLAGKMLAKAKAVDCVSRLSRIGIAIASYSAEHNGELPYGNYRSSYPGMPFYPTWEDFLIEYVDASAKPMVSWSSYKKTFVCPASPAGSETMKAMQQGSFSTSYTCNGDVLINGVAGSRALRMAAIRIPSRNLVLACGSLRPVIPSDKLTDPRSIGFDKHPGGANLLFLDGHVERATAETIEAAVASQIQAGRRVLRD